MHRDVKLGLALGILLIGFAAAFCFPRRPAEELAGAPVIGPKLALVDREILERRVRSFVGEELDPGPEPTLAAGDTGSPAPSLSTLLEPVGDAPLFDAAAATPAPIAMRTVETTVAPMTFADDWSPQSVFSSIPDGPVAAEASVLVEERHYTVQPGDTLSGIASKMMGSSGKYGVLFEANREVLRTPDSLKPGMVLTIPLPVQNVAQRGGGSRPAASSAVAPALSPPATPLPQPEPIPTGAIRMATSQADESEPSVRSESAAARAGMFRKAGSLPFTTVRGGGSREDE